MINGSEIAGKIALIDRGDCFFVDKVKHAQNAGAIAVIIANNVSGPPPNLGGNDPTIAIPSASVTLQDGDRIKMALEEAGDPGTIQLSADAYSAAESSGVLTLGVVRAGGTEGSTIVRVETADGTATAGGDYVTTSAELVWQDGEDGEKSVEIPLLDDDETEGDETFELSLLPLPGTILGSPATATATILDDDVPGIVGFSQETFVGSEDVGVVALTVVRAGGDLGEISVDFATENGSAIAGEDYVAATGTVTFADRDSDPKMVMLEILDDELDEDDETFRVRLSNPTGGVAIGTEVTTVSIVDGCTPSELVACLNGGRFELSMTWKDFEEQEGDGRPVDSGVDDSVLFFFFSENNWEALVKVLDGCAINGHYWVFGTATTNVEYTLRVTDTLSGVTKEYFNPLGTAAPALTDTSAFATCP